MKFHLTGRVCWAVGSCHDDRSEIIDKRFIAPDEKEGIKKARVKVEKYHMKYPHMTDYGMGARLRVVGKSVIWETDFVDDKPAEAAVPARKAKPARPAVPAHFVEKRFKKTKS